MNDDVHELPEGSRLQALMEKLAMTARSGLAVAVNDSVVSRASWDQHALADGDSVLIIQATQGG